MGAFLPCMRDSASSPRGCGLLVLMGPVERQGWFYSPLTSHGGVAALGSAAAARRERPQVCVLRINSIKIIRTVCRLLETLLQGHRGSSFRVIRLFPCQRRHDTFTSVFTMRGLHKVSSPLNTTPKNKEFINPFSSMLGRWGDRIFKNSCQ